MGNNLDYEYLFVYATIVTFALGVFLGGHMYKAICRFKEEVETNE